MSLIDINRAQTLDNVRHVVDLLDCLDFEDIAEGPHMGVHVLLVQISDALKWLSEKEAKQ